MIDKYSELGSAGQFEPQEEVKGDIARAMMYTYTIYRDLVAPTNPGFFFQCKKTFFVSGMNKIR